MQEPQTNFLAPRPGLEPGTYGLTVERTACLMGRMSKIRNAFFAWPVARFSAPNLCRTSWLGLPIYLGGSRTGSTK